MYPLSGASMKPAVAALAVAGVAQSQPAAPAPSPSQPSAQAVPQGVPQTGPQATTSPAPEAAKAASGMEAPAAEGTPVEQKPRQKRGGTGKSNFMPANPDATPILPGQPPKSQAGQGANAKRSGQAGGAPRQSQSGAQAGAANAAGTSGPPPDWPVNWREETESMIWYILRKNAHRSLITCLKVQRTN